MASGIPTDHSPAATGSAQEQGLPSPVAGSPVPAGTEEEQWRRANLLLERRYLELGRTQIDEMCLDLKARLAGSMSAGLQRRLAAERPGPVIDLASQTAQQQVEAAAAMSAKLLEDLSWVLPWEQARSLVEPYAKGSWLLAQIQANEEQRVITVFAAELVRQTSDYIRELIFRYYGAETSACSLEPSPPALAGSGEPPRGD